MERVVIIMIGMTGINLKYIALETETLLAINIFSLIICKHARINFGIFLSEKKLMPSLVVIFLILILI